MKRRSGFSLIELLVTITILSVLLYIIAPSFLNYIRDSRIVNVGYEMETGLEQAKIEAIRRNAQIIFTLTGTGWTIVLPSTSGGSNTTIASRKALTRESNIVVTPTTASITFNGSGRTTPPTSLFVTFTEPSSNACRAAGGTVHCMQLNVSAGGQIKYCDPALPTTNARGC